MAGIYIHIPFCKSRCIYCDFYKITDETSMDSFVDALLTEITMRKEEVNETIQTIYFGGGTPSRLNNKHFESIFNALYKHFDIQHDAEITVETNPDDLSEDYLSQISQQPINRLSVGIQSFNDKELKFLSRRHSAKQAIDAVKRSQQHGFSNISIDLMYGLPGQSIDTWSGNLRKAIELGTLHLSAYHLIYEEKTRMRSLLEAGKIKAVDEETGNTMFSMLIEHMEQHGFIHYEVTAFGKDGFFSRHNSSYWKNEKYVGLGPAAHSYDGNQRSWNIPSLKKYINGIQMGKLHREVEQLSQSDKYNELILTGLRTMWGINLLELRHRFGEKFYHYCMENANPHIDKGLLTIDNINTETNNTPLLKTTRKGIFIADGIASDLMWID